MSSYEGHSPSSYSSSCFDEDSSDENSQASFCIRTNILDLICTLQEAAIPPPPESSSAFNSSSPPHAFPTPYPPHCPTDPFPSENGVFKFPAPVWRRTQTIVPSQRPSFDIDDLASAFASKLHLREGPSKKSPGRKANLPNQQWVLPTIVIPSRAPHPALRCSSIDRPHASSGLPLRLPTTSPLFGSESLIVNRCNFKEVSTSPNQSPLSNQCSSAFLDFTSHSRSTSSFSRSRVSSSSSFSSINEPSTPPLEPLSLYPDTLGLLTGCHEIAESFVPAIYYPSHASSHNLDLSLENMHPYAWTSLLAF